MDWYLIFTYIDEGGSRVMYVYDSNTGLMSGFLYYFCVRMHVISSPVHATFNQLYSLFKYMYVLKYNLNFCRLMFPMQRLNQNVCKVYLLTRICLHVISVTVVLLMKLFQSFKLTCCVYSSALEVV